MIGHRRRGEGLPSSARALATIALACGLGIAACGDDLPRLTIMIGGNGGASAGGGGGALSAGAGGRGGAGSSGGSATGTGGSTAIGGAAGGRGGAGGVPDGGVGAGGTGGWGPMTPGYAGCSVVGGVDRIRVSKLVSPSGLCFDFTIWLTTHAPPAGLKLPKDWALMGAVARPCAGTGPSTEPSAVTGSADWGPQFGFNLPPVINVDVTFTFASVDAGTPPSERLTAQNVDIQTTCPR